MRRETKDAKVPRTEDKPFKHKVNHSSEQVAQDIVKNLIHRVDEHL